MRMHKTADRLSKYDDVASSRDMMEQAVWKNCGALLSGQAVDRIRRTQNAPAQLNQLNSINSTTTTTTSIDLSARVFTSWILLSIFWKIIIIQLLHGRELAVRFHDIGQPFRHRFNDRVDIPLFDRIPPFHDQFTRLKVILMWMSLKRCLSRSLKVFNRCNIR